ncbi:MAG: tetratricopeptide repeat protein [Blastocatellia bacterium]
MRVRGLILFFQVTVLGSAICFSQSETPILARPTPAPKLSEILRKNLSALGESTVSREKREQAFSSLLAGQRYLWSASRLRSQTGIGSRYQIARQSFQKAVEFDPKLAEGYTALAELAVNATPADIDEAISLGELAIQVDPQNYGSRRILARLYTFKSRLNSGMLDQLFADKAIKGWNEIAKLDPRNAEAWAFLSEFYGKTGNKAERLNALRKWVGSASPVDTQFFRLVMGSQKSLAPEAASVSLAQALFDAGNVREAVEIAGTIIADDPGNNEAMELLSTAVESANPSISSIAIDNLQQAVFANPESIGLAELLVRTQVKAGKFDDAVKQLRTTINRLESTNIDSASALYVVLGDTFANKDNYKETVSAYEKALTLRGSENGAALLNDAREFALQVYDKLIQIHKRTNRPNEAKAVIERARRILGKEDLFADRQLIGLYREAGKRQEALTVVRSVRSRFPSDIGFLRQEASILTEMGKVDEAVVLIKRPVLNSGQAVSGVTSANGETTVSIGAGNQDEFSNLLFISSLYNQAGRGKDAIAAANQAFGIARSTERRQIAKLTLATAQQMSGDFGGAENTLREILTQTPRNPIALNNLGYFLLERNERIEEAFGLISQAVKIDPTNPSYLDSLGWAYFKLGKHGDAERYLRDAARIDPASPTIHEHLGDVLDKLGKLPQAREAWELALRLASENADLVRLRKKLVK